jgi:lipopolysaccharide transport system permease protein
VANAGSDVAGASVVRSVAPETTVIVPTGGWSLGGLTSLWRYRQLAYFLAWRDVKVRYKQTALGVIWAVIQPLYMVVLFTLLLHRLAHLPSENIPYPLFIMAGTLPWMYFAYVLMQASNSLVGNSSMVSKVHFPRLILPISSAVAGFVDFAITGGLLCVFMLYFHVRPSMAIVFLPFFMVLLLMTGLGVAIWLAAVNVKYRDVRYVLPMLTQVWMFSSPVVYSRHLISGPFEFIYNFNPMTGVIDGFRWAILGTGSAPTASSMLPAVLTAVVVLVTGIIYFQRQERFFADII